MTQIFDPETGGVTPVTVIEAGPCPGRRCGPRPRTATTPCSSRSSRSPSGRSRRASSGTWRRTASSRTATLVEFRGRPSSSPGETVTVEAFEPGDRVKVAGIGIGKGFAGTIKRHNFHRGPVSHGSHNVRKPGLDRRLGDALARVQGNEDGRPDGRQAPHAARPRRPLRRRGAQPPARQGRSARPEERPRRDQGGPPMATPKAPLLDGAARSRRTSRSRADLRRRGQAAPRPRGRARRAQRASRRHAAARSPAGSSPAAARSRGARRAPAAPAPARSARRSSPAAASRSRR